MPDDIIIGRMREEVGNFEYALSWVVVRKGINSSHQIAIIIIIFAVSAHT